MIRAQKVWGVDTMLVVSQDFQVRRALYIARTRGIAAAGVAAKDPYQSPFSLTQIRELYARVKMLLEVHLLNSQPRFLGPREVFPGDSAKAELR
jgi:SanA protein